MQLYTDELGITYNAGAEDSLTTFNRVIEAYLSSRKAVMPLLDDLIDSDPEMPLARCFRGYLLKLAADPRFTMPLLQIVKSLDQIKSSLTPREQQHVKALASWTNNDIDTTVEILEGILTEYPRDMLALRIAHYLHFYAGASANIRDSVARSLAKWHQDQPFYGYLLGMHSFGLEESGDYALAEALGKQAVDRNPDDIWAAHAVTHVYQMQSRFDEGVPFVQSLLPVWQNANNFLYHMHWHQALCHIGLGEADAALAIYDSHLVRALADDFYLDICNAASLLWRLEIVGVDVGDRWDPLLVISNARITDNELLFSSIHYLITPARLGDKNATEKALQNFRQWAKSESTQGHICRDVGLPLAEAIVDLGTGDARRARRILTDISDKIVLIGGSHAQRDLFNQLREYAAA
ncbi:MAG: tetratricopeptide repeat protein [Pseudomonadales bacterium]